MYASVLLRMNIVSFCNSRYNIISGGSRICKRGAKVERRRREDRGAEGAQWPSAAGASIEAPKAPMG